MGDFFFRLAHCLDVPGRLANGLFHLLINGAYQGYNPFPNHLLTSWDIQVVKALIQFALEKIA